MLELEVSELEQYSPLSCQTGVWGKRGAGIAMRELGDAGMVAAVTGRSTLGQTMREWFMHCYHWVGRDLLYLLHKAGQWPSGKTNSAGSEAGFVWLV